MKEANRFRFRAWNGQQMSDVFDIWDIEAQLESGRWWAGGVRLYGEDNSLMQSTGLLDSGGVEIFEGDVLHYGHYKHDDDTDNLDRPMNFAVRWGSQGSGWVANGRIFDKGYGVYGFTVIGNIHENPELMEA